MDSKLFDISKYQLPDELKSADFTVKKKIATVANNKVSNRRANFMLTMNPNLSPKLMNDLQKRQLEYAKLQRVNERIREAMLAGRFVKPNEWDKVNIETWRRPIMLSYTWKTQIGSIQRWLHTHAIIRFDGLCTLDINAIRDFIREDTLYGYQKFNLQSKFIPDSMQNAEDYIDRDEADKKFKEENKGTISQILRDLPLPKVRSMN